MLPQEGCHDPIEDQEHGEDEYTAMASLPSSKYVLGCNEICGSLHLYTWKFSGF